MRADFGRAFEHARRMRWRDISSRPKAEMRPTWMRARSFFSASFSLLLDRAVVAVLLHVDEVDHDQAGEVAQAELAGDFLGASRLVWSAVSSILCSLVERPELTSIATSASVGLMTM
jgi:hypothetical protein